MGQLSQEEIERTRKLYQSGMPIKEMAKALEISTKALDYRLRKYGIRKKAKSAPGKLLDRETLCWDCKYAAMGDLTPCPWHQRNPAPREDWEAKKCSRKYDGKPETTYTVIRCPGFEKG